MNNRDPRVANAERVNELDWKDWVLAYVSIEGGGAWLGYMGRRVRIPDPGFVELTDAIEYASVMMQLKDGRTTRVANGQPIEFRNIRTILVRWCSLIEIDKLESTERNSFAQARLMAMEVLRSIQPGTPKIEVVEPGLAILGPDGRRIS